MPKTRSSAKIRGHGGAGSRGRDRPRPLPAADVLPAPTSGDGDGADSGGTPSTLGQDYPHFLDIIRQEVRLQLASLTPASLPPSTSSTEVPSVPPIPPLPVSSTAPAPSSVASSSGEWDIYFFFFAGTLPGGIYVTHCLLSGLHLYI